MIVIGTFRHSIELEQALAALELRGIPRDRLLVVMMDDSESEIPYRLTNKSKDFHVEGTEIGISSATFLSVIGASVGFILKWGPVIWGIIAAVIGFGIGFAISYARYRIQMSKGLARQNRHNYPDVTVIVQCRNDDFPFVRDVMWKYRALTVGMTPEKNA